MNPHNEYRIIYLFGNQSKLHFGEWHNICDTDATMLHIIHYLEQGLLYDIETR